MDTLDGINQVIFEQLLDGLDCVDLGGKLVGDELEIANGAHWNIRLIVNDDILGVDWIGSEGGHGKDILAVLKGIANNYGYKLKALGVLPDAAGFWAQEDFVHDGENGNDYIWCKHADEHITAAASPPPAYGHYPAF